jgi:hypothetical protein
MGGREAIRAVVSACAPRRFSRVALPPGAADVLRAADCE